MAIGLPPLFAPRARRHNGSEPNSASGTRRCTRSVRQVDESEVNNETPIPTPTRRAAVSGTGSVVRPPLDFGAWRNPFAAWPAARHERRAGAAGTRTARVGGYTTTHFRCRAGNENHRQGPTGAG